jgi:hypothetical protein
MLVVAGFLIRPISIHALREEGDGLARIFASEIN